MSQHHVARCDGPGCKAEVALQTNYSHATYAMNGAANAGNVATNIVMPATYSTPPSWLKAEGREFCSWLCMGAFAASMENVAAKGIG